MVAQLPNNNCSKLLTSSVAAQDPLDVEFIDATLVSLAKRAILLRFAGLDMSLLGLSHSPASRAPRLGKDERIFAMASVPHPLASRVRSLYAFVAASLRKSFGIQPRDGDFTSQRMCPFCGLITPRHETCCLECGKSLKPA
jgi:hypothetical protein